MKQKKRLTNRYRYIYCSLPLTERERRRRERRISDSTTIQSRPMAIINQVTEYGERREMRLRLDFICYFFFFLVCVFALYSLSLYQYLRVSLYIYSISPFFCVLCLLCACLLFVPLLLYANVSRAWWGVILFALGSDIYRHVSIKDTSPRGYIVPLSSPGSFVLIGPSPNPHSQSPNTQQQPEIYIN